MIQRIYDLEDKWEAMGATLVILPACCFEKFRGCPKHWLAYRVELPDRAKYESKWAFSCLDYLESDLRRILPATLERLKEIKSKETATQKAMVQQAYSPNFEGAEKIERNFAKKELVVKILPASTWGKVAKDAAAHRWEPEKAWGIAIKEKEGKWTIETEAYQSLRHVALHLHHRLKQDREDQIAEEIDF